MPAGSHRERVIAAIRVSSRALDDDQIAARTGISPRQTVNQICRALERAGMVRRRAGPDGKVVNKWLGTRSSNAEAPRHRWVPLPGRTHLLMPALPRVPARRRPGTPVSSVPPNA
jgi:DNA-binding IclR family transcriptional regulator